MPARLEGLTAVVVGGGQAAGQTVGNGRAVACRFAAEGARVLVVDRSAERADDTCSFIVAHGGDALSEAADITDEAECARLATTAQRRLGRIDILHNNVGIVAGDGDPLSLDVDHYDSIMGVNLRAMWLTCKHVLPLMRARRSGAIVNISSVASLSAGGSALAYSLSKAAVNQLTRVLARSNAPHGIRVNAIMPGLIDTPMAIDELAARRGVAREDIVRERTVTVPMGRMGTAEDIANAALFFASPEAAFVTGVVMAVDGGQTLHTTMDTTPGG